MYQKRALQAFTDKSLKIAVFPIILALVRHFMQFERDFFPGSMYLKTQKNDSHTHFKSVHISLEVLMSTPKLKTNRVHGP